MSEIENASILGDNLTAIEAISTKLAEVTRLAEKLDARLCEAGAKTRPMSIPTVVTSSASSLLSISAISPLSVPMHTASTTTTLTSGTTASAVSITPSIHLKTLETVATRIKSDPITAEKFDESSLYIHEHSAEDVETSNQDFNTKVSIENSHSESVIGECNMEGYTTATECSTTPPPRSRSESFVTSPECEDLSIIAPVVTCSSSTWLAMEKPKITNTIATIISIPNNKNQKFAETTSNISISGVKPTARIETMDKIINEKSNRIVKEVTETTVLRVSHDIQLGVSSYKVISNTMQDHRQHFNVKDIQNMECVLEAESYKKTNGTYHHLSPFKESKTCIDKSSKKIQSDQDITTKLTKIEKHMLNGSTCSDLREYKNILASQDHLQYPEDSEIEISSTKKDDNLEGKDFLEKAKKL